MYSLSIKRCDNTQIEGRKIKKKSLDFKKGVNGEESFTPTIKKGFMAKLCCNDTCS